MSMNRSTPTTRAVLVLGAVLVGAAVLAACGAATRQTAPAPKPATDLVAAATPSAAARVATAPASVAAAATPSSPPTFNPCTTNARSRLVYVSLRRQHLWMCDKHRVAYSTAITSGMAGADTRTPTGSFHIQGRNRNSVLTLNTGATYNVKYWIPFEAPLFGFHDSSWQRFPYGSPKYRTDGSHGCVHMPLIAIRFLYNWSDIGTAVRITA
jgi:lipoprotein-anchoring transpeptidase ErfK/SrfK